MESNTPYPVTMKIHNQMKEAELDLSAEYSEQEANELGDALEGLSVDTGLER